MPKFPGVVSETNVPVPVKLVTCGLLESLSVTTRVPARGPGVAGVRLTLIVHLCPFFRVAGQLLVWEKSPVVAMLVMVNVFDD